MANKQLHSFYPPEFSLILQRPIEKSSNCNAVGQHTVKSISQHPLLLYYMGDHRYPILLLRVAALLPKSLHFWEEMRSLRRGLCSLTHIHFSSDRALSPSFCKPDGQVMSGASSVNVGQRQQLDNRAQWNGYGTNFLHSPFL